MVPSAFSSKTSNKDSIVLGASMIGDVLPNSHQTEPILGANSTERTLWRSQEIVYRFLLSIVNTWPPESVLQEFKRLFIYYETDAVNSTAIQALSNILFEKNEEEFKNTLKRCCYILINNWDSSRNYKYIVELVELFAELKICKKTLSPTLSLVRLWLANFACSPDYEQLQLFAARYENNEKPHWSHQYTSYLLVPQYADVNNPIEQREAARSLYQQLKDKFKFELAMYTTRSQSAICKDKAPKNPTHLGDEVLRLIKTIVAKKGTFSYTNLANIFIKQTEQILYKDFKQSLKNYLLFSLQKPYSTALEEKLTEKLENLYKDYEESIIDDSLLLRTCNRVIEYLTTEDKQKPSQLFIILMSHGNPLTLVVVLLKIILICKMSRTHLETRIAELIQYYKNYPEEECNWIIKFLDVFNIAFAIHADNVKYNLIKVDDNINQDGHQVLGTNRIFSQLNGNDLSIPE